MRVREIEKKDHTQIAKIIRESLESFSLDIPGTAYDDPELDELSNYYQQFHDAKYWVLVNDEDKVYGGVGIAPFQDHHGVCELQKLYIAPNQQGQGYSKLLMDTALQYAAKYYTYCYLETSNVLVTAKQLYIQYEFTQLDNPLEGSTHHSMDLWYLKKLR